MKRLKFDLVRRGVGGRTVAELSRRMAHRELIEWAAYRDVVTGQTKDLADADMRPIDW